MKTAGNVPTRAFIYSNTYFYITVGAETNTASRRVFMHVMFTEASGEILTFCKYSSILSNNETLIRWTFVEVLKSVKSFSLFKNILTKKKKFFFSFLTRLEKFLFFLLDERLFSNCILFCQPANQCKQSKWTSYKLSSTEILNYIISSVPKLVVSTSSF